MAMPREDATIQITVGSYDVSGSAIWTECRFEAVAGAQPGTCEVSVRDPNHIFAFNPSDVITLWINGERKWQGYLFTMDQTYVFPDKADERKWVLHGVDLNILLDKLILYNHTDPRQLLDGGGTYKRQSTLGGYVIAVPKGTSDHDYITAMMKDVDWSKVTPTIDTTSLVGEVGVWNPDGTGSPPRPGLNVRAFFENTSASVQRSEPGSSVWYINPDAKLVYQPVDTDVAPFWVGDDNPSTIYNGVDGVTPRGLTITTDISRIKNWVLLFTGNLSPLPNATQQKLLFKLNSLTASTTKYRYHQYSEVLTSDWLQGAINARSTKILYQEGGPAMKAEFTVFRHGLAPGQIVTVVCLEHDIVIFDTTKGTGIDPASYTTVGHTVRLPVRSLVMTFPTPHLVSYQVTCSIDTQDPWGLILALKRPATRGLSTPQFQVLDFTNPDTVVEPAEAYTLVKEWPVSLGGGKWQCRYAYIRDSLVVIVGGQRRIGVPDTATYGSTVGFLETSPDLGQFQINSGTPYVEYHVWHDLVVQ